MTEPESDDKHLREFLENTSHNVDPHDVAHIDDASDKSASVMTQLDRRRSRYDWAVYVPLFLIGGFFALRAVNSVAASSTSTNQTLQLDLGISMFMLMIAFLVYTKSKQERSDQ